VGVDQGKMTMMHVSGRVLSKARIDEEKWNRYNKKNINLSRNVI
jgi:hypothetical protein